jgi:hypothetical protein
MTNPQADRERPGFLGIQARRVVLRWFVIAAALRSLAFWTLAILGAAWLVHWGFGWAVAVLAGAWFYFLIPVVLTQLQLIVDVLSCGITGRSIFFPRVLEMIENDELNKRRMSQPPRVRRYIRATQLIYKVAGDTSPLAAVATWSLIVLIRMPLTAHRKAIPVARSEIYKAIDIGHKVEHAAVEAFAERMLAGAR